MIMSKTARANVPSRPCLPALVIPLSMCLPVSGAGCDGSESSLNEGLSPSECLDTLDNDFDGLIDCLDPGCQGWDLCQIAETGIRDTGPSLDTTETGDSAGTVDSGPVYHTKDICINEFMASNRNTINDAQGASPDWIELYNMTDEDVDLGGYYITDDLDQPDKHVLADGLVLPARGYLLLWAAGDPSGGPIYLSFSLSVDGEDLGLFTPEGTAVNRITFGEQYTDWSVARIPDGSADWYYDSDPTPMAPNG